MRIENASVLVTGGASGLGYASAEVLIERGAIVTLVDLPTSDGVASADKLGPRARFVAADVTDPVAIDAALDAAAEDGPLRAVVHCAGRGGPLRVLDKEGNPSSLDAFGAVIQTNLIGTFNVLSRSAARMAAAEEIDGERGVVVMTASVAAFEGQIG